MFYNGIEVILLNGQIQKEPWILVNLITGFFGFFMNMFYNLIDLLVSQHTLGFAIIGLTIFVRFLMLPLAIKQQKSMAKMQALTPEIDKIKEKYGNTKDPELSQKMNREIQEVYTKNGVNPFAGCLPLFIQMPMFIALNYIFNQPYLFIDKIGELYHGLAANIMSVTGYYNADSIFYKIAVEKVPKKMQIDLKVVEDVEKVLNKVTEAEWASIVAAAPADVSANLSNILGELHNIEYFFGINLTAPCGWALPGLIIPILAAFTTFLTSYLSFKKQPQSSNPSMQSQQKIMMYGMPLFMGFITAGLTAGVGVYWITSNFFQIGQQIFINKSVDKEKENIYDSKSA